MERMDPYQAASAICQEEYKAAGYRKLQELKLLKAAAARLVLQPDGQQQMDGRGLYSSSGCSSASASSLDPLMRSFSNIEHVMPQQQRLSRTSSTDRQGSAQTGLPPRLGRSNSAGQSKLAAFLPQPSPHMLVAPTSTRAAVSAAPVGASFEAVSSQASWHRAPRHSEPITGAAGMAAQDERVEILLAEVESLLAERQQMSARMHGLQRDNDQLAELVGRMARTLQEQEVQIQQLQHQQHQQQHSGSYLGPLPSLSLPPPVSQAPLGPTTPAPASITLQQHHLQRQRRVDEWLGRKQETWQEWQERVPLEHMHSGSSSTLTVSLDQQ